MEIPNDLNILGKLVEKAPTTVDVKPNIPLKEDTKSLSSFDRSDSDASLEKIDSKKSNQIKPNNDESTFEMKPLQSNSDDYDELTKIMVSFVWSSSSYSLVMKIVLTTILSSITFLKNCQIIQIFYFNLF